MDVAVFDTHVRRPDGRTMHFDILVRNDPAERARDRVLAHGRRYLAAKGLADAPLDTEECRFCHIESASAEVQGEIDRIGFAIIELGHCD